MRAEQTLDVETLSVNICALAGDAELILDTLFPSSALRSISSWSSSSSTVTVGPCSHSTVRSLTRS